MHLLHCRDHSDNQIQFLAIDLALKGAALPRQDSAPIYINNSLTLDIVSSYALAFASR